ncbi:uncharacterized protein LOC130367623 isoform X2 [Hyla sarda]|uniref:uncharacterized protein LOC130367623 isoform X2 n=1 Tax=Hyla sarda TaxID=327740 RepID=UPI0024C2C66F|nr:uncharacterized protein LOC130367623 isoform X2 [Hyla sarda]
MRRLVLIVLYILGGAGSVQQSSSLMELNFTQLRSPDLYLVSCTPQIPEEQVFQVHWKEEHTNGSYSMIAVLSPHWGNYTKFYYQERVKLHKKYGQTYTMELMALKMSVCCEAITFPSGTIYENCITIEEDSDAITYNFQYALLGTLLVGGFFFLASVVLICHICWMRKTSRSLNLRGARQQLLTRSRRSEIPYRRTSPSVNLAYEAPHNTDLHRNDPLPRRAHLQNTPPIIQLDASEDLSPRNPTMNSHWSSEEPCPTPSNVIPAPHHIYTNVLHRNNQYPKARNVRSLQIEPTINQHQREMFSYEDTDPSSSAPHVNSHPWLFEGTSYSSEDITSPHSFRLNPPRTPESPFMTINPMYHTGSGWAAHPKISHLNYEHSMIS